MTPSIPRRPGGVRPRHGRTALWRGHKPAVLYLVAATAFLMTAAVGIARIDARLVARREMQTAQAGQP